MKCSSCCRKEVQSMSINIAIDGPAGVGKSTVAKALAQELGYTYIDTGALYRALGVYFADRGLSGDDEAQVEAVLDGATVSIEYIDGEQHVYVNGEDVTDRLRTEEISRMASKTSGYAAVRAKLLDIQRELAASHDSIMDGRDIGTVILPHADLKIFMTARPEIQAKRRYIQLDEQNALGDATLESILADIRERDYRDSHRDIAPLKAAEDAVVIDTSDMNLEELKSEILDELALSLAAKQIEAYREQD
jgi:CMP/dCMP kinase